MGVLSLELRPAESGVTPNDTEYFQIVLTNSDNDTGYTASFYANWSLGPGGNDSITITGGTMDTIAAQSGYVYEWTKDNATLSYQFYQSDDGINFSSYGFVVNVDLAPNEVKETGYYLKLTTSGTPINSNIDVALKGTYVPNASTQDVSGNKSITVS